MPTLSRRSLISSAATLPALAVPTIAAAAISTDDIQIRQAGPTSPENPDLLALGEQIEPLLTTYRVAAEREREARAMAETLCPPLPDDLVRGHNDFAFAGCCTGETDIEGQIVHAPGEWRARFILSSRMTKDTIARGNIPALRRTKHGREVWRLIQVAEKYEAGREAAIERSGILKAVEERKSARARIEMLGHEMRRHQPATTVGVVIMARALAAFSEASFPDLGGVLLGHELAIATLRVAAG
jgi:hypothetical protein